MNIRNVYSRLYLYHVQQLVLLVETLERAQHEVTTRNGNDPKQSTSSRCIHYRTLSCNYGQWVKHVLLEFTIPRSWELVYSSGFVRLLNCCPNLEFLSIKTSSPSPLISWNTHGVYCPIYGDSDFNTPLPCIEHISIGVSAMILPQMYSPLLAAFRNIVDLELPLRAPNFLVRSNDIEQLSSGQAQLFVDLCNLRDLTIIVTPGERVPSDAQVMGTNWRTPTLRSLSIVFRDVRPDQNPQTYQQDIDIVQICRQHGINLEKLLVEEKVGCYFSSSTFDLVFKASPKLVDVAVPCIMLHLQQPPRFSSEDGPITFEHTHLQKLKIFLVKRLLHRTINDTGPAFMHWFASTTNFPALVQVNIVRVAPRDYQPRFRPRQFTVRKWARAFENTRTKFTVFRDGRIVPLDVQNELREGEVGDDDDDDPDYIYTSDSDSDTESSVDYDSDIESPKCLVPEPSTKVRRSTSYWCCRRWKSRRPRRISWEKAVRMSRKT